MTSYRTHISAQSQGQNSVHTLLNGRFATTMSSGQLSTWAAGRISQILSQNSTQRHSAAASPLLPLGRLILPLVSFAIHHLYALSAYIGRPVRVSLCLCGCLACPVCLRPKNWVHGEGRRRQRRTRWYLSILCGTTFESCCCGKLE